MFSRLLLLTSLAAALLCIDHVAAQPRRLTRPYVPPVAVKLPSAPVSTPVERKRLKQVIYAVADLVIPLPTRPNLDVLPLPLRGTWHFDGQLLRAAAQAQAEERHGASTSDPNATPKTQENLLIQLVTSTVAPKSWTDNGGKGTLQYFPLGHALVVSQTKAIHEDVRSLLEALRRLQDVEACLDIRMIQIDPKTLEQVRRELKLTCQDIKNGADTKTEKWIVGAKGKTWKSLLDQDQQVRLLKLVQNDRGATVMQAPKITMFNGQIAAVEVIQEELIAIGTEIIPDEDGEIRLQPRSEGFTSGLRLALKPVVSADRKSVRVEMNGYWSQKVGPVAAVPVRTTLKTTNDQGEEQDVAYQHYLQKPTFSQVRINQQVSVPDGGAVLINAGIVPIDVPCVGWLSWLTQQCTGQKAAIAEDRHVLFLVSPRVIVNEPTEQVILENLPAKARP